MTQRTVITGVAVAAAFAVLALFFIFNPFMQGTPATAITTTMPNTPGNTQGLAVQDEVVGTGAVAQPGDLISVNYTGRFDNGTVFDTSIGKPPSNGCTVGFCFVLGTGQVIPGWDQGLQGMKVGGKRILIVPPSLAYGAQGLGPIPPNATLTFEVELLKVTPSPEGPAAQ